MVLQSVFSFSQISIDRTNPQAQLPLGPCLGCIELQSPLLQTANYGRDIELGLLVVCELERTLALLDLRCSLLSERTERRVFFVFSSGPGYICPLGPFFSWYRVCGLSGAL